LPDLLQNYFAPWHKEYFSKLRLGPEILIQETVVSDSEIAHFWSLNCSIRCRHVLLTTEKIRTLVDNIRDKKDRDIEGEVVKKDDDDG